MNAIRMSSADLCYTEMKLNMVQPFSFQSYRFNESPNILWYFYVDSTWGDRNGESYSCGRLSIPGSDFQACYLYITSFCPTQMLDSLASFHKQPKQNLDLFTCCINVLHRSLWKYRSQDGLETHSLAAHKFTILKYPFSTLSTRSFPFADSHRLTILMDLFSFSSLLFLIHTTCPWNSLSATDITLFPFCSGSSASHSLWYPATCWYSRLWVHLLGIAEQ